jgi:glucan phosphoethanolaminetransferase (alkaline phosphatase superfamily)
MFKQRLGLLFIFTFMYLFINGVFRNVLFFKELEFISAPVWQWFIINGVGTFRDLVSFAYPVAAFALLILLAPKRIWDSKIYKAFLLLLLFLEIAFVTFQVFGEWFFWEEFNSRFNFIAVDYLIYTKELVGSIYESFPMTKLYGVVLTLSTLLMLLLIPFFFKIFRARENLTFVGRALLLFFCLGAPFLSFFVIEDVGLEISENQVIDQLSRNGLASFCKAFWQNSIDFEHHYKHLDQDEMMQIMEQELAENNRTLKKDATGDVFIKQELASDLEAPRLNVVFIVVESLAAKFLGHYGSQQGITPNLDALIPKAMVFNNIYATGTRTVRGLEVSFHSPNPWVFYG